jgi:hypothetical protein
MQGDSVKAQKSLTYFGLKGEANEETIRWVLSWTFFIEKTTNGKIRS